MLVTLKYYEIRMAALVGLERWLQYKFKEMEGGYTYNELGYYHSSPWDRNIEGAAAEYAAAKGLGLLWNGSYNTFKKQADLGCGIQVRQAQKRKDPKNPGQYLPVSLIVRPDDKEEDVFILVVGTIPTFKISGWLPGIDAMQEKYIKNPNKGPEAWFVPQCDLRPIETLPVD